MKQFILFLLSIFILTSCTPQAQPPTDVPTSVPVTITATSTNTPEPTITSIPATVTLVPTETRIPCDPTAVDYCITDGHFVLQRPVQPPNNDSVDGTYRYASTANGTREPHHGVEIGKNFGTPIVAAADGVILVADSDKEAVYGPWTNYYGNMIVIQHAEDLFTLYAHLSKIDVAQGDAVTTGQKIGEMGQSGAATGSHLHFEVRRGNVEDYFSTMNPELWIQPKDSTGGLKISVVNEDSAFQPAELTIALYHDANEPSLVYYVDTYDKSLAFEENAGLSDLPAGRYRITLIHNGQLYERWLKVQSGKLTETVIVVK